MESPQQATIYVALQGLLIALFAAAVFVHSGPGLTAPLVVRWTGGLLCVVGLLMMAAALSAMGRVMQVSPMPREEGRLVTRGIYRRLRHPMYTSIIVVVIGMTLREPRLLVAIAGIALTILLLAKARFEEGLLMQRYPDYAEYRRHTWSIIPGTGRAR
jgi:protein-S-isoprenylcysteine O-methyltransferase Ste14